MQRLQHHSKWIAAILLLLSILPFPATAQLTGKSHVRMGVVLPLKEKSQRGAKMVEFYQGMLMAVDSVCNEGLSTEVIALHSGSSASEIQYRQISREESPITGILSIRESSGSS